MEASGERRRRSFEYASPTKLDYPSGNYFAVPSSMILSNEIGDKRVTTFSFFSVRRGLDCKLSFSLNSLVQWAGRKPDRHKNGVNSKFLKSVQYMIDEGYLLVHGKITNSTYADASFEMSRVSDECNNKGRFAIIYLDELNKILRYKNPNPKDTFLNSDVVLLVFSYLRMRIFRRRNELLPEEINIDNKNNHGYDVEMRRISSPDVYSGYYCEIADDLGLTARAVSKAVDVLNDMKLIYYESLPRVKNDGKWKTTHTLFCNFYKREGGNLLAYGEDYYIPEIKRKKDMILDK